MPNYESFGSGMLSHILDQIDIGNYSPKSIEDITFSPSDQATVNAPRGKPVSPLVSVLASTDEEPTAVDNGPTRLWVKDPKTGKINSGLQDGTDPRQFADEAEMRAWQRDNNEIYDHKFNTAEEAIQAVRKWTGNPDYNGYYEGYRPPAPQIGSPAARNVDYGKWLDAGSPAPPNVPDTKPGTDVRGAPSTTAGRPANGGFGPNYTDAGYFGDQNATVAGLPKDLQDALRQLMDESRNQVAQGKQALTGITSDYKDQLAFQRSGAEQSFKQQQYLTNLLLGLDASGHIGEGGYTPGSLGAGISSAIGTMNDASGLSPEAMAALRLQATEGPENAYQGQVSQLKTQLAGRGAYGGGDTPGSLGDIVGGYAPLMANRDSTRSQLLSNAILANEQRKFDTLGLNRNTAAQFGNIGAGLTTGLGNVFNPSSWLNTGQSSLAGLSGIASQIPGIGFQGINTAGDLARTLSDQTGTSFMNLLKSSLAGAAGNAASNIDWGQLLSGIFGGGNSPAGGTGPNTVPPPNIPQLPLPTNIPRNPNATNAAFQNLRRTLGFA